MRNYIKWYDKLKMNLHQKILEILLLCSIQSLMSLQVIQPIVSMQ
jgi:hypothetical protein